MRNKPTGDSVSIKSEVRKDLNGEVVDTAWVNDYKRAPSYDDHHIGGSFMYADDIVRYNLNKYGN